MDWRTKRSQVFFAVAVQAGLLSAALWGQQPAQGPAEGVPEGSEAKLSETLGRFFDGSGKPKDSSPPVLGLHSAGVLGGRISGQAGAGPGVVGFLEVARTHGVAFQLTPGVLRMGGLEQKKQEIVLGPSALDPAANLVQQIVVQKPSVLFFPIGHIAYAPFEIAKRVRPIVGGAFGVASVRGDAQAVGRIVSVWPDGRSQVMREVAIGTIPARDTKFAAALTTGASVRVDSTGRHTIDVVAGFFPGGSVLAAGYKVNLSKKQ